MPGGPIICLNSEQMVSHREVIRGECLLNLNSFVATQVDWLLQPGMKISFLVINDAIW
jgi:hypothetical protein